MTIIVMTVVPPKILKTIFLKAAICGAQTTSQHPFGRQQLHALSLPPAPSRFVRPFPSSLSDNYSFHSPNCSKYTINISSNTHSHKRIFPTLVSPRPRLLPPPAFCIPARLPPLPPAYGSSSFLRPLWHDDPESPGRSSPDRGCVSKSCS